MKFPAPEFWWWCKVAFWSVDLAIVFAIALAFIALELHLGPFKLPGTLLFRFIPQLVLILVIMHAPPSRWIFRRWFRVTQVSQKRRRLADWNEVNKGLLPRAIRKEPWFQKPS